MRQKGFYYFLICLLFLLPATPSVRQSCFLSPESGIEEGSRNGSLEPLLRDIKKTVDSTEAQTAFQTIRRVVLTINSGISDADEMARLENEMMEAVQTMNHVISLLDERFPNDDVARQYISRLRHHLFTGLNPVTGYTQLLAMLDPSENPESWNRYVAIVVSGFKRFETLFNALSQLTLKTFEQFPREEIPSLEARSYFIQVDAFGKVRLSTTREFPAQAKQVLESPRLRPFYESQYQESQYQIEPGSEAYDLFLSLFLQELRELPFDHSVGRVFLLRPDAKEVVKRLTQFILDKGSKLDENPLAWQTQEDLKQIRELFSTHQLEVFKNDIYPEHGIEGVGYSLDLGVVYGEQGEVIPSIVRVERYTIVLQDRFSVSHNGSITLNLLTGDLLIDLDEERIPNPHHFRIQSDEVPSPKLLLAI